MGRLAGRSLILVVLAVLLSAGFNWARPISLPWFPNRPEVAPVSTGQDEVKELVTLEYVQRARQDPDTVVIDARGRKYYMQGHIPGALSFPAEEFYELIDMFRQRVAELQPIIVYCGGDTCEDSHMLHDLLISEGYADVKVFQAGMPAWEKAGLPVETGEPEPW
jgi:3-mercaptopyruvate sulfurtransferase SseA